MVYSGAVEVRPFQAKMRLIVSEAEGLSCEAVKRNPTTTVILGVDENKSRNHLLPAENVTEPMSSRSDIEHALGRSR